MSGDHDDQSYEARQRPDAPLGTLIFRAGLVPADSLEEGVRRGRRLGEILLERELIQEDDLARLLASQQGLAFVDPLESEPDPDAVRLLPEDKARLYRALPIGFANGTPLVAVADRNTGCSEDRGGVRANVTKQREGGRSAGARDPAMPRPRVAFPAFRDAAP